MSSQSGVVVHITAETVSGWTMALQNLANLVQDASVETPPEAIEVVVNGPGVRFLRASAPEAENVAQMLAAGVTVAVCERSVARFDYTNAEFVSGVTVVPSGVAEVLRAQEDGARMLKLP
ncbi:MULTISPECIES: DsrE family protein [Halobacterium]|uniref:DsrE domain protein n=4 Tax=Halobacterium salinarum TaxID=2242 RepID=Q9HP59_HALSA|nr:MULTISPECIES: DsrE family protein [Halobacterium]AAG20011.1 hypothetical protein VNG_1790H [Halobacterium salinarum NRC-1]MBB6089019.1 hypothetical protein [Halobacterium salinarum]MCF2164761.1 DsrE family protein [Halobacterium salinarum]MCF2167560.1 DsrE family protein [Halobacterium salinarum]MCF2206796.1 DsrE family protein [Halobacterium salinarum]